MSFPPTLVLLVLNSTKMLYTKTTERENLLFSSFLDCIYAI